MPRLLYDARSNIRLCKSADASPFIRAKWKSVVPFQSTFNRFDVDPYCKFVLFEYRGMLRLTNAVCEQHVHHDQPGTLRHRETLRDAENEAWDFLEPTIYKNITC